MKKSKTSLLKRINKIGYKSKHENISYSYLKFTTIFQIKFLLIGLYIIFLPKYFTKVSSINKLMLASEITVIIKGTGDQYIIPENYYESFYSTPPDKFVINGQTVSYSEGKYQYTMNRNPNTVIIKWNDKP